MKIPESLIREYVQTPLSAIQIGDLLTMTGFEIEGIEAVEGEQILDVNIMANRGDGASVVGIAREVLAKDPSAKKTGLYERAEVRFHAADESDGTCAELAKIVIESANCSRYACRVFESVKNGPSPEWLQKRLRQMGQRPISFLVDLTNYVMFETGQPLHAFDLDKLTERKIVVRQAKVGETTFTTLDGVDRTISPLDLMICDARRPVAIAGVMGGLDTEVSSTTTRMLLESANFDHRSVRNTRTRLGLATEASYRFERYVDPEQVVAALNRFAELYEQTTGDAPVRGVVDEYPVSPLREPISLRMARCERLLGVRVDQDWAEGYLSLLGFHVESGQGELRCIPPTWRIDVEREDDVIEEVGRVHGYEKIPEVLPHGETTRGGVFGADAKIDRVREELLRCGLTQIMSHSLRDGHALDATTARVRVRQPHSPDIAHLRNSTLPSLSDAVHRNGLDNLHLFEVGNVFEPGREWACLGVLSVGGGRREDWQKKDAPTSDFYSVKGTVERVLFAVGTIADFEGVSEDPRLHPTRQARIIAQGRPVGVIGQIHPTVAEECGLRSSTILAEIDLSALVATDESDRHLKEFSRNPAVRRDIAFVVKKSTSYKEIECAIQAACGDVLEDYWLFDVYDGKGIEHGSHSLAIALQLRKLGENFTDEEANRVRDRAVAALESLGAILR